MKPMGLFFVLVLMVLGTNSYAGLDEGLVSAWTFDDGTANDAVGDNDGEFVNGASTTDGEFGMALNLENPENPATGDNSGQYVEIPSSSSLEKEDGIFSVSLWVYVRPDGGRNHAAMFFKGDKVGWGDHFMVRMCTTSDVNMTWAAAGQVAKVGSPLTMFTQSRSGSTWLMLLMVQKRQRTLLLPLPVRLRSLPVDSPIQEQLKPRCGPSRSVPLKSVSDGKSAAMLATTFGLMP